MKNSKSDRIKAAALRALEEARNRKKEIEEPKLCLLYTSDAADE